ncbi:hypothetical protein ACFQDD_03245 [Halorubrum pallidum]|uniref:Uncharacterized protein n=1 Tax=Halorubrum pallidum TaxID=1526114 RepID=A0ABD5SZ98_9EURY
MHVIRLYWTCPFRRRQGTYYTIDFARERGSDLVVRVTSALVVRVASAVRS